MREHPKIKFMNYEYSKRITLAKGINNIQLIQHRQFPKSRERNGWPDSRGIYSTKWTRLKITSPYPITIKILNIGRNLKLLKAARENHEVTYTNKSIYIKFYV